MYEEENLTFPEVGDRDTVHTFLPKGAFIRTIRGLVILNEDYIMLDRFKDQAFVEANFIYVDDDEAETIEEAVNKQKDEILITDPACLSGV